MKDPAHPRRNVTIRDVARKAGTSPATVSRVLTGSAKVSPEKREAVLRAIQELNYTPNLLARSLKTQRTQTLGVIINNIRDDFYSTVAKGIQDEARENEYLILVADTTDSQERERRMLQVMRDKGVDGVIFAPLGGNQELVRVLQQEGMRLVAVDRVLEGVSLPTVLVDNYGGAKEAVTHLIHQGYQRIGLINSSKPITTYQERKRGYQDALRQAGIPLDPRWVRDGGPGVKDGYTMALSLLQPSPRPDALFITSCSLALGALTAIRDLNIPYPQDLAVVSFDDTDYFPILAPSLTAVRQPAYQVGRIAAALLLAALKEEEPLTPSQTILPVELIVRESSTQKGGESRPIEKP